MASPPSADPTSSRWMRLLIRLTALRSGTTPRVRQVATFIALSLFAVGVALAWMNLPDRARSIDWMSLLPIPLIGVPLAILANAFEFQLIVEVAGKRETLGRAFRLSLVASAANVLPVPGSTLVRADALRRLGVDLRRVAASTVVTAAGFVGISAALGSFLVATRVDQPLIWIVCAAGILMTATALLFARSLGASLRSLTWRLIAIETFSVIVKGFRFYFVLRALGYEPEIDQVAALTSMSVLATASGFFPGGLGLSEALSAAIAPVVGLPAAVGLLTSAIDNFLHYSTLLIVLGAIAGSRRFGDRPPGSEPQRP